MEIREITDKNEWDGFWAGQTEKTFLQSWHWGEFWQKQGNKIWRLPGALAVKITAKRGTFLLVQHNIGISEELINKLREIAQREKCDFIRMAPLLPPSVRMPAGFRGAPMHANAYEATWKLDLMPTENELLKNMRKTTRYLIRQAEKNPDITIEKNTDLASLETYQKLNREVAKRQNFVAFSDDYIKNEFEVFTGDNEAMWLLGKYRGEVAAGALVIFWSGIAFYHQAASLAKYAKFPIPYLLQWEAIKEAKKRGCKQYDFWGFTDPQKFPQHPWAGPSLFKMGFGGKAYEYVKTQDLPLSRKYWLTYIFEKIRRTKRGL